VATRFATVPNLGFVLGLGFYIRVSYWIEGLGFGVRVLYYKVSYWINGFGFILGSHIGLRGLVIGLRFYVGVLF